MPSAIEQIWDAVYDDILAMGLTGITSEKIRQQQFPYNPKTMELRSGIFVCPEDAIFTSTGTNKKMLIHHGIGIYLLEVSNFVLGKTVLSKLLSWREEIRLRYHDRLPINVANVHRFYCEPGMTYLPGAFKVQFDASALIIRASAYEG